MFSSSTPKRIGPFVLTKKTLGSGAKGKVREGYHEKTNQKVAVKMIEFAATKSHEFEVLQILQHPHVVDVYFAKVHGKRNFLVMELLEGGTLSEFLQQRGRLEPSEARRYFKQVLSAVHFVHSLHICHRDIKPENMLFDNSKSTLKLIDFGYASTFDDENMIQHRVGTKQFMAPELFVRELSGPKADIWSLGVTLFVMITGRYPFDDSNVKVLQTKVRKGQFTIPGFIQSDSLIDLLNKTLVVDPAQRPSIEELISHPWVQEESTPVYISPPPMNASEPVASAESQLDSSLLQVLASFTKTSSATITKHLLGNADSHYKLMYRLLEAKKSDPKILELTGGATATPSSSSSTSSAAASSSHPPAISRKSKSESSLFSFKLKRSSTSPAIKKEASVSSSTVLKGKAPAPTNDDDDDDDEDMDPDMAALFGSIDRMMSLRAADPRGRATTVPLPKIPSNPTLLPG